MTEENFNRKEEMKKTNDEKITGVKFTPVFLFKKNYLLSQQRFKPHFLEKFEKTGWVGFIKDIPPVGNNGISA